MNNNNIDLTKNNTVFGEEQENELDKRNKKIKEKNKNLDIEFE